MIIFYFRALQTNSKLKTLSLAYGNNITDEGSHSLANLLETPKTNIKNLDLRGNNMTQEGCYQLINVMRVKTIFELKLEVYI